MRNVRRGTNVQRIAVLGFGVAITVLAAGTAVGMWRMDTVVRAEGQRLRDIERMSSLADQLRWRTDVVFSVGHAYLSSANRALLERWQEASDSFSAALRSFEAAARQAPDVEIPVGSAGVTFLDIDRELLSQARQTGTSQSIGVRFDNELRPSRNRLDRELDEYANRTAASFAAQYARAETAHRQLADGMYAGLVALIVISLAVAWYATRHLSRAFRNETAATEAARQATAARDELMGVVAHDLRNPLAAVTMKSALLRQRLTSEETRKLAESIEAIALRMDFLIQTMLDVTTVEAGGFAVQPAPCTAADLLRETAEMFDLMAASKQIQLEWKVTPPELEVRADRERIVQVLTNLIGNALKFTPSGGRVTVTVDADGPYARFAVADTGHGIAPADAARVFDRFWRKGATSQKGTGRGLFIAKSIVEAHGGRIWVESDVGRGATFIFTVALEPAQETEATAIDTRGGLPAPA